MGEIPVSKIAALREAKGMTQAELAQALNVDISTIRNLERNRSGINAILRVVMLCEIFDCQAKDLIEYVDIEKTAIENGN